MSRLLRQEDPQGFGSQAVNPAILPVGIGAVTMGSDVWGPCLWSRVCGWEEAQDEAAESRPWSPRESSGSLEGPLGGCGHNTQRIP